MAECLDSSTKLKGTSKELLSGADEFKREKHTDFRGQCPEHCGEAVSYFCSDCSLPCCVICSMSDHYKHHKDLIDTGETDGAFGHTGIFFPSHFTVDGLLKGLNEDLQSIDIRADNAKEKIKACVKRHKEKLESSKMDLVGHVAAVKQARLKYLQEQQKSVRSNLDCLIGVVEVIKKHLDSEDHFGILFVEKWITRRVAELNERCSKVSLPSEQDWNLDKIKVISDGEYVHAGLCQKTTLTQSKQNGIRSVHDIRFHAKCAKVEFDMEPEVMRQFVNMCCVELGDKYQLGKADR